MPLINVIRGESIPTAPFTVRTPVLRLPVWLLVIWQAIKAMAWLVVTYVRYWWATGPTTGRLPIAVGTRRPSISASLTVAQFTLSTLIAVPLPHSVSRRASDHSEFA